MGVTTSENQRSIITWLCLIICSCTPGLGSAQEPPKSPLPILVTPRPQAPEIRPASDEAQVAIGRFKFDPQWRCEIFAAEPDVANIVAFYRDYQDRMYVCETFRQNTNTGVEDNRSHPEWMDDEIQATTVNDRIAYILKHIPDAAARYTQHDDRIRVLWDSDGNGRADRSAVFADGFNRLEMGTGADVLSYRNAVYYTCIPELFRLIDRNEDGVADERDSLHQGFGVRFAFRGHDMHGLVIGPDGRLYFSIGDRGYNVSPTVVDPTSGAVFRCELDGSQLEVVATGLRNPQNLAFDDYGNLFTGDNNSDSGDRARWVYVVPGGDSGWRMHYQYLPDRGPFNREKIWHPWHAETPAYIVPPVANFADGPSGLEYYPGTGFGDRFRGRFFLCDFRGTAVNSGIRSFRNETMGAFFRLVDDEQTIWGILPTDLQFAADGKLYVSDWVDGWVGENKGRIYSFADPQHHPSAIVKEVAELLKTGFSSTAENSLTNYLAHADRRVRQEAQFELVRRGAVKPLLTTARGGQSSADQRAQHLARIHALWGLRQLYRPVPAGQAGTPPNVPEHRDELIALVRDNFADEDAEIRAQTAALIGETLLPLEDYLLAALQDINLRVRYFAAMALANCGTDRSLEPLAEAIVANDDADPIVRHGTIMAMRGILLRASHTESAADFWTKAEQIWFRHANPSVRLASVVALRKLWYEASLRKHVELLDLIKPRLAGQLSDREPRVALEAARVVYDLPVMDLWTELMAVELNDDSGAPRFAELSQQMALESRVILANWRGGREVNAQRLAAFAANDRISLEQRTAALRALLDWDRPTNNDPLLYAWRPIDVSVRDRGHARQAIAGVFTALVTAAEPLPALAIESIGALEIAGLERFLIATVLDENKPVVDRVQALQSLGKLNDPSLAELVARLQTDGAANSSSVPGALAVVAAEFLCQQNEPAGVAWLRQLGDEPYDLASVRQPAIRATSRMTGAESRAWLLELFGKMRAGTLPPELRLDVIGALQRRAEGNLVELADTYLQSLSHSADPSAAYADSLFGGDPDVGKRIFETKTEVSCLRCHRVQPGELAVGPNLSDLGLKRSRQEILDSIVQPNKQISEGFGQIKVQTSDGLIKSGLLVANEQDTLVLLDADGQLIKIPQADIEDQQPGLSAMPADLIKSLSREELRDLVAYLAAQKTPAEPSNSSHGQETPKNSAR